MSARPTAQSLEYEFNSVGYYGAIRDRLKANESVLQDLQQRSLMRLQESQMDYTGSSFSGESSSTDPHYSLPHYHSKSSPGNWEGVPTSFGGVNSAQINVVGPPFPSNAHVQGTRAPPYNSADVANSWEAQKLQIYQREAPNFNEMSQYSPARGYGMHYNSTVEEREQSVNGPPSEENSDTVWNEIAELEEIREKNRSRNRLDGGGSGPESRGDDPDHMLAPPLPVSPLPPSEGNSPSQNVESVHSVNNPTKIDSEGHQVQPDNQQMPEAQEDSLLGPSVVSYRDVCEKLKSIMTIDMPVNLER